MKKITFALALLTSVFALPALAQSETKSSTMQNGAGTKTEVDVRSNGTVKTETTTKTGRTKSGEVINDAAQGTKNVGKKVASGTKRAGKSVARGTKKIAKKVEKAVD